jgi:hypothetical protein
MKMIVFGTPSQVAWNALRFVPVEVSHNFVSGSMF